jgi:hypothetical protein
VAVPSDITGLWGWWEGNGSYSGGTWQDSHTTNRDLTQSTGASQPTQVAGVLNGLSVMRFDGADDHFIVPSMGALTAGTVFLVVKIDADPPGAEAQTGLWHMGAQGAQNTHFPYTDGNIYDAWGSSTRQSTGNPTLSLSSDFRTYCVSSSSGNWTSWIDGTQHYTTATNTPQFDAITPFFGQNLTANNWLDGDVAELFIFDSALSTGDRQSMEAYITTKWFTSTWPPPGSEDSPAKLQVAHSGLVF